MIKAFECHASRFGFYSMASRKQVKMFVAGSDMTESLFFVKIIWEQIGR
jgi:NADH:ubiquinone oxidoreductase subunit B-like Fe-S oxidoreductase